MDFAAMGAKLGLDEDEYRELIELFLESGGLDIVTLLEAVAARDARQVMRSAHTIKGASANLGLTEVSAAAKRIEEQAPADAWKAVERSVQLLQVRFDAVRAAAK